MGKFHGSKLLRAAVSICFFLTAWRTVDNTGRGNQLLVSPSKAKISSGPLPTAVFQQPKMLYLFRPLNSFVRRQ